MKFEEIFNKTGLYKADSFAEGVCFEIKQNAITNYLELYLKKYKNKNDIMPTSEVIPVYSALFKKDYFEVFSRQSLFAEKKETVTVKISRVLYESGYKPYMLTCNTHKIKRAYDKFHTLADLKQYYEIDKIKKTNKTEWAISLRGKRHEWIIYEAEISLKFVI